ncbi:Ig-like domain-containing protein [Dyadobacter arcticus]|uniref:Ig-like domain-containing protein n=1 Tax=Dyadobacter arcticus TaxID=1078754 RepID=A0ABX0UU32_9BACT|nr:T9SS type A sorting domain-containing protein [Dyadobacter arcticus]NIJ55419.1 hypothetical protein [Dyadobacter arcticus]
MKQAFTQKNLFTTLLATILSVATVFGQTISKSTTSPASVCPGNSISVQFTPATFPAGTTYTVQVSDAAGSFTTPLATATGTASPINVTIPAGAAAGAGYVARAISTSPAVDGAASDPFTVNAIPAAPTATSPIVYTQNAAAVALSATGTGLLWYDAADGGTGSGTIPVPSTATVGTTSYYVSQTVAGCESPRAKIDVTVNACTPPAAPGVANKSYTVGEAATPLTATGDGLKWYSASTGGSPLGGAPTPSTAAAGSTSYFVSQTVSNCESPRAEIVVTVAACTPPAPPGVAHKNYTVGDAATPLTATGDGLKWYSASSGGSPLGGAPTPSTASAGSTSYFVSQTVSNCESPRAEIVVTVAACTPPAAPTVANKTYTVGDAATPLTATGAGLKWYSGSTGGSPLGGAPTPSTASAGATSYFVSQTVGSCESARAEIVVTVSACTPPAVPGVANKSYTVGDAATPLTATGDGLKWYGASSGGSPLGAAPTPSTASVGATSYFVSQTVSNCESPRAEIVVTVSACTPPAAPGVANKSYTVGEAATPLTATGSGLKWYSASTGGSPLGAAPTPSTASVGASSYFVSQTVSNCESPRAEIVVTVSACTPPAAPGVANKSYTVGDAATPLTATGDGLKWYSASSGGSPLGAAPTPSTASVGATSYFVSQTVSNCESPRAEIVVTVSACTPPAAPGVANKSYTVGDAATPLTATGAGLKWYSASTGGSPLGAAPTPSTASVGATSYFVSQTVSNCESPRAEIVVTVSACTPPAAPGVANKSYTVGDAATPLTATGAGLKWYSASTGGSPLGAAPTPSTASVGATSYFVSQTVSNCESPRAEIVVTVSACTPPAAPGVANKSYTVGDASAPLTATGTGLKWYSASTGGSPLGAAPTPSTASVGATSYFVSQTINSCESPRAEIVVTVSACTPPAAPGVANKSYTVGDAATPLTATGAGLKWYSASTGGSPLGAAPTPSTASVGATSYFVSQSVNSCESARAEIVVTVSACTPPAAPGVANKSYTVGDAATPLTASGTALKWYSAATGGSPLGGAPTPSTASVGTTSYYVTQTVGGCESARAKIDVTISVCTPPPAPIVANKSYTVGDAAVALTATGTALKWYSASTGGSPLAVAPTPLTATAGSTSYFVSQTVGNCESARAVIVVTVSACTQPAAPTVANRNYFLGETATALTATGTNLKWYAAATGGSPLQGAPVPSTAKAGSTNYFVSQTVNNCESARAQIIVTIAPCPATLPLPVVVTPLNICQSPTAAALTATATNNTYTLKWYTTLNGGTGSTTAIIPNATTAGTTSYYVSQTSASGCESERVKIDVIVNTTPVAPIVTPIDYCVGVKANQLTPTGGTNRWYTTVSGGAGSATAPTPLTTTPGTTSYYLTQSNTYGALVCESPRAKQDVVVNPTPAALPTVSDVFCQSRVDSTYKFPTTAEQGNTLNWYTITTGGTASPTTPTINAKTAGEFTYYATQSSAKGCESLNRAIQKVRVKSLPGLPTIEKPLIEYCQFIKAAPLTATQVANGILSWYGTNATGGSASNTAPTPSTAEGGTTSFYVAQSLDGCFSDRAKIDVKINTTPKPTTTTALAFCQNEAAGPLSATGNVLKWYREADGTEFQGVPFTPFTEKVQDYSFYVTQTGAENGCESPKEEIKIHIRSLPSATITGNATIDLGKTATINIKFTGDGPWIYVLSNGITDTTNQANHPVEVKPSTTTTYVVTEVSNACGKGLPIGSALVTVKVPTINSGNPSIAEVCAGKSFSIPFQQSGDFPTGNTFKVQIAPANVDAQFWTIPSVATASSVTATFPDTTKGGSYYIRVISSGTNPDFTVKGSVSSITIIASPLPVATLTGAQTILIGETVTLKAEITGKSPWTFTLNNGTKDSLITAVATPYNFNVTPKTTTTYTITKVTNGCGIGTGVGSARIQVDPILGVEPPASADWVKVYPTIITQSRVTIEIPGVVSPKQAGVEVFDLNGRSKYSSEIQGKITEVDFVNYPSGLYLLRIQNGNLSTVQRVMKP